MSKDSRQTEPAPGGSTQPANAPTPGKGTLSSGTTEESANLNPKQLARAERSNPYYLATLKFTPSIFNAGTDVASKEFALGVARAQKGKNDKALHVDGMAGPLTIHAMGPAAHPEPSPTPGPTPGPTPTPGPAPTPHPSPGPAPTPGPTVGPAPDPAHPTPAPVTPPPGPGPVPQPRVEKTDYGNFYVYPDDYNGPLPPNDANGERIHESDFKKELAKREAAADKQKDKTVKSVDDLLSYGAFDWVITDADATKALGELAALPGPQLKAALAKINTGRLLDNLPAAQRKTPAFAKVIVAMGPDKYRPFINDLLNYGLLDWAITDADAQTVTDILAALPAAEQAKFLRGMDKQHLSRLATHLSKGVKLSNELLKVIWDSLPDTDITELKAIFERRFNTSLSAGFFQRKIEGIKEEWDAPGLRRLWEICATLPPDQINGNPKLDQLLRGDKTNGAGYYNEGWKSSVVGYSDINSKGGYGQIMVDNGAGGQKDVSLNTGTNLFSTVVRHEIGHAVDAKIGASKEGGYVHTAPNAGTWNSYGSYKPWVDAIIAAGGGMSGHGYADEGKYKEAMYKAVDSEIPFTDALKKVDSKVAAPADPNKGPIAAVFDLGRWNAAKNPWYDNPDRQDVGGRLWQRPYDSGDYVSFVKSARTSHGVSGYQFRAPGEWFAEAYAVYYSDQDGPAGTPVGTRLRTRDAAAADWYDKNVDKGHSLEKETNQGGGGGGAGGHTAPEGGGAGGGGGVARAPGGGGGAGGHA